jgi:hypothetical protein
LPGRAMVKNELVFINKNNWLLVTIGGVIFALALWMTIEALLTFRTQLPTDPKERAAVSV